MQSPREVLRRFFAAENSRDWETYQTFLDSEVVWQLHGTRERTIRGIEEYLSVMQQAYRDSDVTFACIAFYQSEDKSRVVAILRNSLGGDFLRHLFFPGRQNLCGGRIFAGTGGDRK